MVCDVRGVGSPGGLFGRNKVDNCIPQHVRFWMH